MCWFLHFLHVLVAAESIVRIEWLLTVVFKHRDSMLKTFTKYNERSVHNLHIGLALVKRTLRSRTLYNLMLSYTNRSIGDQRR